MHVSLRSGLHVVLDRTLPLTGALAPTTALHVDDRGARARAQARVVRAARLVLHAGRPEPRRRPRGARPGGRVARPRPRAARHAPARRRCCSTARGCRSAASRSTRTRPVPVVSISVCGRREAARRRSRAAHRRRGLDRRRRTTAANEASRRPSPRSPRPASPTTAASSPTSSRPASASRRPSRASTASRATRVRHRERYERGGSRRRRSAPRCSRRRGRSSTPPIFAASSSTTARRLAAERRVAAQGAGLVALGAAAAAEVAVEPTTLAFGNARAAGWKRSENVVVRNVSTRPLARARPRSTPYAQGAAPVEFHAFPSRFRLATGETRRVRIVASVKLAPVGDAPAEGSIVVAPVAGAPLRLPWAVTFAQPPGTRARPAASSRRRRSSRRTPGPRC